MLNLIMIYESSLAKIITDETSNEENKISKEFKSNSELCQVEEGMTNVKI